MDKFTEINTVLFRITKLQGVPRNMTVGINSNRMSCFLILKTIIKILFRSHIIEKLISK